MTNGEPPIHAQRSAAGALPPDTGSAVHGEQATADLLRQRIASQFGRSLHIRTLDTGACALGGVYQPDAFVHGSVGGILPVDVWLPGCPPSPLALLQGLLVAVDRLAEKVSALSFTSDDQPGEAGR